MSKLLKEFLNEKSDQITMSVSCQDLGVLISIEGPESQIESLITYVEAKTLRYLLNQLEREILAGAQNI